MSEASTGTEERTSRSSMKSKALYERNIIDEVDEVVDAEKPYLV